MLKSGHKAGSLISLYKNGIINRIQMVNQGGKVTTIKTSKIVIIGPWAKNLGDAAIQKAMISNIRKLVSDAEIIGFSISPRETTKLLDIKCFPIYRPEEQPKSKKSLYRKLIIKLNNSSSPQFRKLSRWINRAPMEVGLIWQAFRNLDGCDYLVISGGGQLDDYWGGAWSHPYTLLKFTLLAKLKGAQILFVSVGAGPIDQKLSRLFIKAALSLANYRSFRDVESKQLLQKIGFSRSDKVYPDLAHSLILEPYTGQIRTEKSRILVGIGPMAYFDPRVWPQKDQTIYMSYLAKLANFTSWLLKNGFDILLFPGEAYHDRDVIADFINLLEHLGISKSDQRIITPHIETVDELMGNLASVDMVVASRFHGVLLAQLLNKPVLALSYHQKIDTLMANMGQKDYCLQIDDYDLETLKERFKSMEANAPEIKATMATETACFRQALNEQFNRLFA